MKKYPPKCEICDWDLLDDLKSVQEKSQFVLRMISTKTVCTKKYVKWGICTFKCYICKIIVNTCRPFLFVCLFKSLNLEICRRLILLFPTFRLHLSFLQWLCQSSVGLLQLRNAPDAHFKKKKSTVCFLQTSKQFQFRHHFISVFHLELIFISLILQSLFLDIAHSMVFWSQIYSLPCPDSRVLWSLNKRFSGFREGWRFWVVQISFCSPFGSDTEMRLNLWCQCAFTLKILRCKGHEQETTISDT